jgi:hypothetical protein
MSVKVIRNRVFDGTKTHEVGAVIEGLSKNDESQLIKDGIVEYVNKKEDTEISDEGEKDSSEEKDISPEDEENISDIIDPNSFALNPDDYVKASPTKTKKNKVV